jgi:hypothetical protein
MHDDTTSASAYISQNLNLRQGLEVESMIAMGYPAEEKSPHPQSSLPYEKISLEKYGEKA